MIVAPHRRALTLALALSAGPALGLALGACGVVAKPKDVGGRRDRDAAAPSAAPLTSVAPPPAAPTARRTGRSARAHVLVHASSRVIALDDARIYYADTEDDAVFAIGKAGGEPVRLARRAPTAGALAIDEAAGRRRLVWVASPGDVVLALDLPAKTAPEAAGAATAGDGSDAQPAVLRDRGIFADVAASNGDVFVAEATGKGGAITRITGATAARIATLDAPPRAIAVDASRCWVATVHEVLEVPRQRSTVGVLATGTGFDFPVVDDANVYAVALDEARGAAGPAAGADAGSPPPSSAPAATVAGRVIVRIPKAGGAPVTIARDVRAAPIAVFDGEVFYFDGRRSRLMAAPVSGSGEPRVVGWDDAFARPNALAVDAGSVYVATGEREDGAILAVARK